MKKLVALIILMVVSLAAFTACVTPADKLAAKEGTAAANEYVYALYRDKNNQLHYLFDAFLALDFEYRDYTLNYDDSGRHSARKEEWSGLINYWFDENMGFQALDNCIAEAAKEIGEPKTKRYVIFVLPDPIYCDEIITSLDAEGIGIFCREIEPLYGKLWAG